MEIELAEMLLGLGAALAAALMTLAVWGVKKLTKKIENDWVRGVLDRGAEAAQRAFLVIQQTFVAEARDKDGDGKLSKKEAKAAAAQAISQAKSYLGSKGLSELGNVLGGTNAVDNFLSSTIEANVAKSKLVKPS